MEFNVRSAFCFSSTGYAPTQQADLSRITRLSLHLKPGQAERYAKCRALRAETVGRPEFCAALRNRVIGQAAQIRANAGTFATAIAAHLGDQRVGDQLGAIISGAYSLASSSLVTPEQASQWVMRQDWGEFQTLDIDRDENQALSLLLNAHVNIRTGSTNETTSVDALASHYFKADSSQIDREDAHDALLLYGLKITDKGLFVHNSHRQLAAMFKDTAWSGKWKDQLARVPDASEHSGTRFGSDRARSVFLPRSIFVQDKPEGEVASDSADHELPF
jgi:putative DNA primase/helicase